MDGLKFYLKLLKIDVDDNGDMYKDNKNNLRLINFNTRAPMFFGDYNKCTVCSGNEEEFFN